MAARCLNCGWGIGSPRLVRLLLGADSKALIEALRANQLGDEEEVILAVGALPTNIPTSDPADGVTIWNDGGVLKLPSGIAGSLLASGLLHFDLLAGGDGDPATYEVTGAALGDEVVFVGHISTAASIATLADVTADFSFTGADELTDGQATDYSNDQLLLVWIDHT